MIEENATLGADWEGNLANIPSLLVSLLQKLDEEGATGFEVATNGSIRILRA